MIVRRDASIAAHNVYRGLAIGGMLTDGSPLAHGMVNSNFEGTSYVGSFPPSTSWTKQWQFDNLKIGEPLPFTWSSFESIANAQSESRTYSPNFQVFVEDQGTADIRVDSTRYLDEEPFMRGAPQGEDNGMTLVVFKGSGTIFLEGTKGATAARQFGPTVLAPFAKVVVDGSAGFVDGVIIALSLSYTGDSADQVQFHGDMYQGPVQCNCESSDTNATSAASSSPVTPTPRLAANSTAEPVSKLPKEGAHKKRTALGIQAFMREAEQKVEEPVIAERARSEVMTTVAPVTAKRQLTIGAAAITFGGLLLLTGIKRHMESRRQGLEIHPTLLPTVDEASEVEYFRS